MMPAQNNSDLADIAIVIPVFNQIHYTKQCVETLNQAGVADSQIIIVNNGSTDGTREFLDARPNIRTIHNEVNRGCGPAWTQGAQLSSAEWTVILNNDVLVPSDCLEGLAHFAVEKKYDIICPAMREGKADYDWQTHAAEFMQKMQATFRHGVGHGVCFMVHRRVFQKIGYFNHFGGYEDDDFFRRSLRAKFRLATTGRAWLHHFGMVTQKSMKSEQLMTKVLERRAAYRKQSGQTWGKRKIHNLKHGFRSLWWRQSELWRYGHTLKDQRIDNVIKHY